MDGTQQFELSDIQFTETDDRADYTCGSIEAKIKTDLGELSILEWVNTNGSVERIDSHLHVNQKSDIESLFHDETPWTEIYDALQNAADKEQGE